MLSISSASRRASLSIASGVFTLISEATILTNWARKSGVSSALATASASACISSRGVPAETTSA
jgi:hypothetical protein